MSAVFLPQGLFSPRRANGDFVRPQPLRGGIASAYNTSIGIGDPVKIVTATGTYALAAAGDAISAVFAGVNFEDPSVYEKTYWVAGTTYTKPPVCLFYPIDDVYFSIVSAGSVAQSAIGDAADHIAGTLNTNSGRSGAYLASASLAGSGGATAQYKIRGLRPDPDNAWGDTYTTVLVSVNERTLDTTVNTNAV